jgi:hypothetical protein
MPRLLLCLVLLLLALLGGCQRPWYRRDADRETYAVEAEHENEALWPVARTGIYAPPPSRMFDPFNPDYPPMPPDDPAADFYMRHPDGQPPARTYHRDGDAPFIEDPQWRAWLRTDEDGKVVLAPEKAVELGLLHSRDYQLALEALYTTALTLTLDRYNFELHWHGTNNTFFTQFGSSATENNTLTSNSDLGFTRNLASGGQFLLDFANSLVFTASGHDTYAWTSNIGFALMQPLLRNAGRRIALETLTQSERNVLYAVRDFAHFRKQFYVNLTTNGGAFGSGYLGLLFQVQNIRNQESNLKSTEQNLQLHEALFARGTLSTVEVDQAFQSYQQGKQSLIQAQTALATALDSYKINLGLPPDLPVKVDDSMLKPFQLAAPELEKLQGEVEVFFAKYRELDQAPPSASLKAGYEQLKDYFGRLQQLSTQVEGELKQWAQQPPAAGEPAQVKREEATRVALEKQMPDYRAEMDKLAKNLDSDLAGLTEGSRTKDWESLQKRSRQMIGLAAQLYVVQTQIRVYLIQLSPIPYTTEEATVYARDNRLDLMNRRAVVVDAWRKIEVAASALKAGLAVNVTGNIATKPDSKNPFDFRASASQYTVGLALDTPLDRMTERNAYRETLILYQVARRNFMALNDQVMQAVRQDVRQLELERTNFAIARQILISAARQLEGARDRLLVIADATDTNSTQNVLNALTSLLNAKSSLISSWLNYEADRVQLLLDMDALQLDPRGLPVNDSSDTNTPARPGDSEPADQLPAPRRLPGQQPGE